MSRRRRTVHAHLPTESLRRVSRFLDECRTLAGAARAAHIRDTYEQEFGEAPPRDAEIEMVRLAAAYQIQYTDLRENGERHKIARKTFFENRAASRKLRADAYPAGSVLRELLEINAAAKETEMAKRSPKKKEGKAKARGGISALVVETLTNNPEITNDELTAKVKAKFPDSAFSGTHASWYKSRARAGEKPFDRALDVPVTRRKSEGGGKKKAAAKKAPKRKAKKKTAKKKARRKA